MGGQRSAALLAAVVLVGSGLTIGMVGTVASAHAADTPSLGDTTISNNNLRDGWDDDEPDLLPANVTASDFGPLFSTQVAGQVYAQPLVVKQSTTSESTLIVATELDNVYGLNPISGAIDWTKSLGTPWSSTVLGCGDLTPDIGVTSTPVYDPTSNTVYVMAKDAPDGTDSHDPEWLLHALDASTGKERAGWPVRIGGHPDNDPSETFDSETAAQRPGLLLLDGVVYAGFASYCDTPPYDGYVAGVSTATAQQTALFSTEVGTDSGEAGIWQSGGGLVSDGAGQIIVTTGNGDTSPIPPTNAPPSALGEAVVRLTVQADGTLKATDWFSPDSRQVLDENDTDFGSGGPMAIPDGYGTPSHPHLLVQDGKDGNVYLLDRDALGGLGQGPGGSDDALGVTGPYNGLWGHPAFWGGGGGAYVYTVENSGYLRALQLTSDTSGVPSLTSVATSTATFGYTSGSPIVTSDGDSSTSALVWVVSVNGPSGTSPVLNAYNALPSNGVMQKVYSAPLDPPDVPPNASHGAKFTTVATDDGRVYVGTRDGEIFGFGHPSTAPLDASPTDFGNVPVLDTSTLPVTLTATRSVTVTNVSAGGAFSVDVPAATPLPAVLSTGESLTVNVTFAPLVPGEQSQILALSTSEGTKPGTTTFDLDGYGTEPGLSVSPGSITFGLVPVGSVNTSGINIVNTSGAEETFNTISTLSPPFSSLDLPAGPTMIQAGASLAIPLTYAPTAASSGDSATLTFTVTDVPPVIIQLTGTAEVGHPTLTLSPKTLNFGSVPRGHSVTKTFEIRNTGNTTLTLEKAAPPSGEFTTDNPVSEGSKILPDAAIVQTITFRPTKNGISTARYLITGDDGKGHQAEQLVGQDDQIADWYDRHDESASFLGKPTGAEHRVGDGYARSYQGGRLYWSPATGVHEVHGSILRRYLALDGPRGRAGFPTTNVATLARGRRSRFSGGWSIYSSPATGAWAVYGKVATRWAALGAQAGRLGYPVGNTHPISGGSRGTFRHGEITWTRAHGYVVTYGSHLPGS
jgi:hypothetical protein